MNKSMRTSHPLFKIINNSLIDLPTPSNISTWNFGSLSIMFNYSTNNSHFFSYTLYPWYYYSIQ